MRSDLEKRLVQAYPDFFAGRTLPLTQSLMAFGCECGAGWYPILDAMCSVLTERAAAEGRPVCRAIQIKEKYATLRAYMGGSTEFERGAVWAAEDFSARLCEVSGRPGRLCKRGGWYATRAPDLAEHEGFTPCPSGPEDIPYIPPFDLAAIRAALPTRHAGLLTGPCEVPVGWADLVDGALDLLRRKPHKPQDGAAPVTVAFVGEEAGKLVLDLRGGGAAAAGIAAFTLAMAKRIDPQTGCATIPTPPEGSHDA